MEHQLWEEPWSYQGQVQKGGAKNLTSLPRVMGQSALGQRSPSVGSWCEHWVPCSLAVVERKAGLHSLSWESSLSRDSSEGPSALQQAGPQGLLVSTFFFIRPLHHHVKWSPVHNFVRTQLNSTSRNHGYPEQGNREALSP